MDEDAVPRQRGCSVRHAIGDGEDYELLFAVSPTIRADVCATLAETFAALNLTQIGRLRVERNA